MKKIAFDVDDVLGGFHKHVCHHYNKPFQKRDYWNEALMEEIFGEYWFTKGLAHIEEFWATMPVNINPSDIDVDVACYMSAFPPEMYHVRLKWLQDNGFPDAPLICSYNKLKTCRQLGIDILVDDKPSTARQFEGTGITCLHYINDYAGFKPYGNYITHVSQIRKFLP